MNDMKRNILVLLACLLCIRSLEAQNFATRQLEYLAGMLKCSLPQRAGSFDCPQVTALPLTVEYNKKGAVSHLGIKLFSGSTKTNSLTKPLYDFQERLFLEVFLQGDETKARQLLKEYKVQCMDRSSMLGAGTFFKSLEESLRLTARKDVTFRMTTDSLQWTGSWETPDAGNFILRFPANYDLISGLDKKELEIWFAGQLQNFKGELPPVSPVSIKIADLEQLRQTVYVKRGDELFVRDMNANRYFEFRTIYDRKYPEESVANLFNFPDPQRSKGLDLQIKQVAYSGESQSYRIKLSNLQCFASEDYDTYTGVEKCTVDDIEFSVVFKSKWYNHSLLLYVQTTPKALFEKTGALQATLYTFIPNQNIKNLYKEHIQKQAKHIVKK